jgi:hypothetical protein
MLRRVALVRNDVSDEHRLHHQGEILSELGATLAAIRSVLQLIVTANVVSSSPILFALIMAMIRFTETSVLTRATRPNIPEDGFLLLSF